MRSKLPAWSLAVASLALLAGATRALADDGCPDTRARAVPARVEWAGEVTRCRLGLSIFGLKIGTFGPRCPDSKYYYPAHQECAGDPHEGTYCMPAGNLDVMRERCACAKATLLSTGLTVPDCECEPAGTAGHVEDAQTFLCPGVGISG